MLNGTVCDGPRLNAVLRDPIAGVKNGMNIGYKITKQDQDLRCGIPLSISGKRAKIYLGFFMHLQADDARQYMLVKESMTLLALDENLSKELLHYDFQRDKYKEESGYPEAHLQVCASSEAWELAGQRPTDEFLELSKMHLPVGPLGGKRFRPTLEDVIEFLIVEKMVEHRESWQEALYKTRKPFHDLQLKAAVRKNQFVAKEALEEEGWTVNRG